MRITPRLSAALAALVLAGSAASAQQPTTEVRTVRQCTVNNGAVSFDAKPTVQPDGRVYTDTTMHAVRVNQGGNSVPITKVNTSDKAQVSTGEPAKDTLKVADIPPRNSERNAVRVNVGGGSKAVTQVNTSSSASTRSDSTVTVPTVVIDCTDSMRTRKP